ncbi:MAG: hypothetical protein ACI9MR_004198 [Myxococcota bacterium]
MNADEAPTVWLLQQVFRLEGQRTLGLAKLGREPGAEAHLESVDARLNLYLEELGARRVAYPGHAIARQHGFGQPDYLLLQLALASRHGDAHVLALTTALGDPMPEVRLSHAIRLLFPGVDSWDHAGTELRQLKAVVERFVLLSDEDDPTLSPSQAVRELLGLS